MSEPESERVTGALYDVETGIENAIRAYDRETNEGNSILTGWVVVAEWIDENGDPALSAFAMERMPYWRINALLEAAPDQIEYDEEDWD
jgi:hypothetical protein